MMLTTQVGGPLFQTRRRGILAFEFEDHAADVAIALVGLEQAQAFVRIAPSQDLNSLFARAPRIHGTTSRHIEIDRVATGQGPAVIINFVNLTGGEKPENRSCRPS